MSNNPLMPGRVVIVCDATKYRNKRELELTVDNIRLRRDILHGGDTLTLLGILHRLPHPMGHQMQASPVSFWGTNMSAMKDQVSQKVDKYVNMLLQSAEECKNERVDIEVMITAGTPIKKVVLQQADLRFYLQQISSKVALIHDNLSVEVLRPYATTDMDNVEHIVVYSISKPVPLSAVQDNENNERSWEHRFSSDDLRTTSKQQKSVLELLLPLSRTLIIFLASFSEHVQKAS
ncbi:hypothetical protein LOK49_LG05G02562 [Camellia lanceoleosa]|uniref:Uncharacterized protein n=1 Tax=Camellia lanceoleosa TaxID=1840588 RepID=A0ACC0HP17_9ERIC|nr:hypothetical protein LOK49_LG05G02562 [Camellia lanceoleosa]